METIADPIQQEEATRNWLRIAGWWGEESEHWPLATGEAAELLASAGYAITAEQLADMVGRHLLPAPGLEDGSHEWLACDLVAAAQLLEDREQWQPTPSPHDRKKHPFQIALENARHRGIVAMLAESGGPIYDVAGLLPALVKCETLEGRRQIVALLKATLETDHGVVI